MEKFNRGGRHEDRRGFKKSSMHSAICDECGRECEVPFRPTGDRPIYCNDCFQLKREGGSGKKDFKKSIFEDKKRYAVICSKCGKSCEVPFKPTEGKPVYCDECFGKGGASKKETGVSKEQFEMLNAKLDKIIKLLSPNVPAVTSPKVKEVTKKATKEVKASESKTPPKKVAAKKVATKKPVAKKATAKNKN